MNSIIHFETFLVTGILLNLTPGNDTIFILSKSIARGRKAGIVSALGIGTGSLVHTLLAALGLSVLIAGSLWLFNLIKFAGAVYLVYLGIRMITERSSLPRLVQETSQSPKLHRIYRDAILTNLLNPKVALFFIAFLPQFIVPGAHTILPFLLLGFTFIITGTIWCLVLAIAAAAIFSQLNSSPKATLWVNRFCGTALIALGIRVAFTGRR